MSLRKKKSVTKSEAAELDRLGSKGKLDPKAIVAAARREGNPLHGRFEWDNTKAAHQYRIEQARTLIQIYVKDIPDVGTVRAFVSLRGDRHDGGYVRTEAALESKVTRASLVAQMKADVRSVLTQYAYLRPTNERLFLAIEKLVK